MIVAELKGGLGNNLFQLAAACAHGVKSGVTWGWTGTPDPALLRVFPDLDARAVGTECFAVYNEPSFHYHPLPASTPGMDTLLRGYFQSWRYFAEPAQERAVRSIFRLPGYAVKPPGERIITGVHVRRGDYLQKPECHPVLPMAYYAAAREAMKPEQEVNVIISDDPGWAREHFVWPGGFGDGRAHIDFVTLARCHRVICANSTFSWWAAWLGRAERVILPRPWFGPALPHDTRDLLPPGWQWLGWTPEQAKEPA